MDIVVSVADAKISNNPQDTLVTHALGSCIGVMLYDRMATIAGMLHFQLPSAQEHQDRAAEKPNMFADTGMAMLLDQMFALGAQTSRLRVTIVGGAEMLNDGMMFNIGRRNHTAIRKILWEYGLLINGQDIGGTKPRSVYFDVIDGAISIKSDGEVSEL